MPYIIETQRTDVAAHGGTFQNTLSRTAVATLDEARETAFGVMGNVPRYRMVDAARFNNRINTLLESGGTIGPLPDGTVIEVRQVGYVEIAAAVDDKPATWSSEQSILAAFNAA